mgnify:CR=1 FL=1
MDSVPVELIGWAAGLTNLLSSVPQLIENISDCTKAAHQSSLRNLLQFQGNILWLIYGIKISAQEMVIFASCGSLMAFWLLIQVVRAKRRTET